MCGIHANTRRQQVLQPTIAGTTHIVHGYYASCVVSAHVVRGTSGSRRCTMRGHRHTVHTPVHRAKSAEHAFAKLSALRRVLRALDGMQGSSAGSPCTVGSLQSLVNEILSELQTSDSARTTTVGAGCSCRIKGLYVLLHKCNRAGATHRTMGVPSGEAKGRKNILSPSRFGAIGKMQTVRKLVLQLCLAALPLGCVGLCEEMHNRTWHDLSGFLEYTLNSVTATRFTLHAIPYPGAIVKYINDTTVTIDPVPNPVTGEHNLTAFISTVNATVNGTLTTDSHTGECTTLNLGQAVGITVGRPGGCINQYTKDDCDICVAPFTGGRCGWCESLDGVHKLCFNVGSLWALDNTSWTCDHKAGPPPPPPPPEPTGFFKCDVVANASTTVTILYCVPLLLLSPVPAPLVRLRTHQHSFYCYMLLPLQPLLCQH